MTTKPELDRAIEAADRALRDHVDDESKELDMVEYGRTYARALIAKLIEQMPQTAMYTKSVGGYNRAIQEMRKLAGLEVKS
jgi:hypothetical protein